MEQHQEKVKYTFNSDLLISHIKDSDSFVEIMELYCDTDKKGEDVPQKSVIEQIDINITAGILESKDF